MNHSQGGRKYQKKPNKSLHDELWKRKVFAFTKVPRLAIAVITSVKSSDFEMNRGREEAGGIYDLRG